MGTVELRAVTKSFGAVEVIKSLDLSIGNGEFVCFVGPSGSGKSTLLRMIAGLESVTAGDVLIDGQDVTFAEPSDRGIAMVFQSYALYPHMNVYDNIAFNLKLSKFSKADIDTRVKEAAQILRLGDLLSRSPAQLSGGQRQRVAIGRAIVRHPKVFLFDEPLSNLDAALRVQMRLEIERLHRGLGTTMIYVTHDQVEAMTLADRIVALEDGNIQQIGAPLDLYANPGNLFVAGFIGSPKMNFLTASVQSVTGANARLSLDAHPETVFDLPLSDRAAGVTVTVGVRPESVTVLPEGTTAPAGMIALPAHVETIERLGNITFAYMDIGATDLTTVQIIGPVLLKHEQPVTLVIDPATMHVFAASGEAIRLTL